MSCDGVDIGMIAVSLLGAAGYVARRVIRQTQDAARARRAEALRGALRDEDAKVDAQTERLRAEAAERRTHALADPPTEADHQAALEIIRRAEERAARGGRR